jgi:hypothetical protein
VSAQQLVTIISRALAVYFLAWLLTDLTYLPSTLFSFLHHQQVGGATFLRDSDLLSLTFRILRIVALFFAVQWFYRAGPTIQRYFLSKENEHSAS